MKKTTLLSLLLVILLPFLLGNSAYPYAYPNEYTAYSNTAVIVTEGEGEAEHTYAFTLMNVGEGYIDLFDSYLFSSKYGIISKFSREYKPLLGPGASIDLLLTSNRLELEPTINCTAFTGMMDDATYSNLSTITKEDKSYVDGDRPISFFKYSFSLKTNVDQTYYYSVMITYEYEENTYYTYYNGDTKKPLYFYRGASLDETKMTITNIEFIKGRVINPLKGLQTLFVVFGLIGIASLIFYIVIIVGLIMLITNQIKKKRARTS